MREMVWNNCGWMDEEYRKELIKNTFNSPVRTGGKVVGTAIKAEFEGDVLRVYYDLVEG